MKSIVGIFIILLICIVSVNADTIYLGMYGDSLIDSLVKYYKASSNLGYDNARDKMYGEIDKFNDTLTCVYTGFHIYMNPSADPSTWAYDHGMNCEHTWPQSLGASGIAKGDMHHLFPTEIDVNGARGNLPFGEINDASTDRWWINGSYITTIPTTNIDEYSEVLLNVKFEPREIHKGNASRAMFYFYTMYKDQYLAIDPGGGFWNGQKDELYAWHYYDIADSNEINRTNDIAVYQQNKRNPFVLDSTLIRRAYYPETGIIETIKNNKWNISSDFRKISIKTNQNDEYNILLYNISGRIVFEKIGISGNYTLNNYLSSGIYFCIISSNNDVFTRKITIID